MTSQLQKVSVSADFERLRQEAMMASLERLADLPKMLKDVLRGIQSLVDIKGPGKPSEFNNVEADFVT